nr:reverse transcriptase domain-containing protein [Tanacetum cinerariifolium]
MMADNRTMAEMLRAPTEGCAEAIVVPLILAEQFELKHNLINMMTSKQFFGLETDNPHDHISGNLLEKSPQGALTIIENKSKVRNSRSKPISSPVKACDVNSSYEIAKLTHAVNQQTSAVTTAMTAMLKQLQATPPPALVKAVEEICVTCGGAHPGLVTDGPTVPTPPKSITPEVDERVEETYTDPNLAEYTIKVPPPPQEKDEVQIQKFWKMFKQLHLNITLAEALVLMPKYQKMLKALLSNKEKLQELPNTPLNENCSAIILKKLPEKLGGPGKFLIPCGFSEPKCKALADLGASINLMPLSVWKELGLPDLIPTTDFVVVDYESDPRVPLILGRPFLSTARALIDVHGEEMILRDGDERLTLNMKHDIASYSNNPRRESINLINILNVSSEDCLEFDIDSDLREIEFLLYQGKDSNLKDLIDQTDLANLDDYFVDLIPEMFTDEHAPDYSSPPRFDVYDDDFLEVESDADNVYDDPFDSKGEKIKESKLLIDELDLPCSFLPYSEYDSFNSQDFFRDDDLPSTNNEDKVFNPGILIHEKYVKIITRVVQEKKLAISYASLVFEDFDPPFCEPLFFKDVPKSMMLLLFSSENVEKVFKPGIYTSEKLKYGGNFVQLIDLKQALRGRHPMLISNL